MTEPLTIEEINTLRILIISLSVLWIWLFVKDYKPLDVIVGTVILGLGSSLYVGYARMLESQTGIQTEVYYPVKVFKNGDQTGTILVREGNELIERKLEGSVDKIIETVGTPKVVCQGYEPYRWGGWTCTAYVKVDDLLGGSYTYKSGKTTYDVPVTDYDMEN